MCESAFRGKRCLSSPKCWDWFWGPPSLPFSGYWGCFPPVKWPGSEVNHSSPSSTAVNNEWSYTFLPPVCLYGMDRGNFAFTFTPCASKVWNTRENTTMFGTHVRTQCLEHTWEHIMFRTHMGTHNVWNTCENNVWNTRENTCLEHTWEHTMFGTHVRTQCLEHTWEHTMFGTHLKTQCLEHTWEHTMFGTHVRTHNVWNTHENAQCLEHSVSL